MYILLLLHGVYLHIKAAQSYDMLNGGGGVKYKVKNKPYT